MVHWDGTKFGFHVWKQIELWGGNHQLQDDLSQRRGTTAESDMYQQSGGITEAEKRHMSSEEHHTLT